jgi:hypothetical protein
MKPLFIVLVITGLLSPNLNANELGPDYRDQDNREIKALSNADIESIQQGKGLGMAKPAELNGYPGPRHVLDMDEELGLTPDQQAEMTLLYEVMQARAIALGERYLEAEQHLEQAFRKKDVNPASLRALIDVSAQALADLRYEHLGTHLETVKSLSRHQVSTYNQLRGYDADSAQHHLH